ncbi:hypothetical protein GCM10017044_26290 [Kordiimonas sediminis]|uniref:EF-hand domain-containing protein n=1 Tax=Kordiimonas sediminis TaxID=1735581 RepID=A0A919AWJ6_9PROT|nr:EF-hand domain-containing protein [Kordiimonas sediminis]GHF29761.1 hypothetical protein GCM10017044_26290 [Kordiimonas sediminis]
MARNNKIVWFVTLAVAAAYQPLSAQEHDKSGRSPEHLFEKFDADSDGRITHDEFLSGSRDRFTAFDANEDGYLVLEELPEQMPVSEERKARRMEHKAERKAKILKKLEENGVENPEEHFEKMRKERKGGREGAHPEQRRSRMSFIGKMDKDGDERVSLEEFSSRHERMFSRMDADQDGAVTVEEARSAHATMRHTRQHNKNTMKAGGDTK